MKQSELIIRSAMASVLAIGLSAGSNAWAQKAPMEKCAGIAKAAKNDCGTAKAACAGTSKVDGDKEAWLFLPKGTCNKIVGGVVLAEKK